ncbi:response regulator [Paenibacillus sp. P25]|nr:response regulator [Paenibacillus sp. P25]
MTASILLIEDEKHIARVVQLELQHEGYEVTVAEDGLKGLDLAVSGPWDLILLDVMLPGLNGMEVLRRSAAEGLPGAGHHADGEGYDFGYRQRI